MQHKISIYGSVVFLYEKGQWDTNFELQNYDCDLALEYNLLWQGGISQFVHCCWHSQLKAKAHLSDNKYYSQMYMWLDKTLKDIKLLTKLK